MLLFLKYPKTKFIHLGIIKVENWQIIQYMKVLQARGEWEPMYYNINNAKGK